ncbi:3-hydroxybutyryl-CoA dehydrogenase [Actinomycetospora sp. OC33-EN08]|uniref:3-hydroxybutyryl-CoA dehydrogenase n=1 Tax=Actinomycetospora aurantiaca TaxID=3129233 RepID=A0ABU8ML88_9PSEU
MSALPKVGVVGGGQMGSGIAEVFLRAGCPVHVVEHDPACALDAEARIRRSLDRAVGRRKIDEPTRDAAVARLTSSADLGDLADRGLVVEAVVEDEAAKTEIFATLDKVVEDPSAILASNTSSIPIMRLAIATDRAEHVLGMHFFNPAPVLDLVEIVPSLLTSTAARDRAESLVTDVLGKQVVRATDRAGFVVNALLVPYLLSAIRMVESGTATAHDVDTGMRVGCAHPMGPLELADLIGLDTVRAIAESLYSEFAEPQYAPPPLLSRMTDARLLGRKTGRGFHDYSGDS